MKAKLIRLEILVKGNKCATLDIMNYLRNKLNGYLTHRYIWSEDKPFEDGGETVTLNKEVYTNNHVKKMETDDTFEDWIKD